MNIIIFLIILLVLVIVHEFGHFYSAKKFGIRVDEFGFGFPPKLYGIKKGETEYTFNLLPLGGFVKIFGENPDDENTYGSESHRSFVNKEKWKQAVVLFAGVFANFLLAWLLFSIGFMSGFPTSVDSGIKETISNVYLVVVSVTPKSPADLAGLKSGDKIISLVSGKEEVSHINTKSLKDFIISHGNKEIEIGYIRGKPDERLELPLQNPHYVKLNPVTLSGESVIGISMDEIGIVRLPPLKALIEGMKLTLNMIKGTALGLYTLVLEGIHGRNSLASITGPVGMVGIVGDAYQLGFVYLLSFAALISVNLAVINLLPLPALDGGRLFFLLIEKIKGSRINPKIVNTTNMVGFGVLILLMLVITYHDVVKLF